MYPNNFTEEKDPAQQNSSAESSWELTFTLLFYMEIKFIFHESVNWNILLKSTFTPPRQR